VNRIHSKRVVRCVRAAVAFVVAACLAPIAIAKPPLERALASVPDGAAGVVVVPSLKRLNDDLVQCLERMDRPGTAVIGRPIDQIKARLGIAVAVADRGSLVAWWPPSAGATRPVRLIVPTDDPAAFLAGNFEPRPDEGDDAHVGPDGRVWFARSIEAGVLLSTEAEAVRTYAAGGEFGASFLAALPERWRTRLLDADVVVWGGSRAISDLARQGREEMPPEVADAPGFDAEAAERWREAFETSLEAGLVAIDVDPLGVAVRTFATLTSDSPLGEMVANARPGSATFDRLPGNAFYLTGSLDLEAVGGATPLRAFAGLAGIPEGGWLEVAANLQRAQVAVYPSRLGVAAGGFFNDAALAIEATDAAALRQSIEQGVAAAEGDAAGLRWTGNFERDRSLRKGGEADAFEVGQTAIPAGEEGAAGVVDLAQRQLAWQIAFGSRGLNGFFKTVGEGWSVLTFSQRPDVLSRAIEAAGGAGRRLDGNGAIRAMRSWLPEGSQAVGFVGVGQFGRLLKQLARMVPGGAEAFLPELATNIEPIGFGLEIGPGTFESAVVVPSGVLGLGYDAILDSFLSADAAKTDPGTSGSSEAGTP
jgi:hypothetical protein